jgi:hypothetical protein
VAPERSQSLIESLGLGLLPGRILARSLRLQPPRFAVRVRRDLPVPMSDGARLFADHYVPQGAGSAPTILIRTPYGRGREMPFGAGFSLAELPAQQFAAHGFNVLVQGVRGCYGSEGSFTPHLQEAADGAATVAWLRTQPWFDGRLGSWGPSYLGYTQWATAAGAPGALGAMLPIITSADPFTVSYPDGAFGLETRLRWAQGVQLLAELQRMSWRERLAEARAGRAAGRLHQAFSHLPLIEADRVAVGRPMPHFRELLRHESATDRFWRERDHSAAVAATIAPVHLIGGWHDYFLRGQLRDYDALVAAGRRPYLTIGPWHHADPGALLTGVEAGLRWFQSHLQGQGGLRERPVRIFVSGARRWQELETFPPASHPRRLYLQSGRLLAPEPPPANMSPATYRYNPADPTPALGGALLSLWGAGVRDNRPLEARADLVCFTTAPLTETVELIGWPQLELFASSSLAHTDFFARICDLHPDGRSLNVGDGFVRVAPGAALADDTLRLRIALGPMAHSFRRGHRIRLLIASGAHPRWARNLGTGEPIATATTMRAADQTIFHDAARPSCLVLPVTREDTGY